MLCVDSHEEIFRFVLGCSKEAYPLPVPNATRI
jgi:hypothetical protein